MKHLFRIALGGAKIRLLLAIALVFLCACGEEHIETLTLGPYEVPCVGALSSKIVALNTTRIQGAGNFSTMELAASILNRDTFIRLKSG